MSEHPTDAEAFGHSLSPYRVVIIGGGVSGALTAVHLLRQSRHCLSVVIVEPRQDIGLGLAYSTACDDHLLNVPAAGMSALAEEPEHFLDFARRHLKQVQPVDFLSRNFFGFYIRSLLAEVLEKSSEPAHSFTHVQDLVKDMERCGDVYKLSLAGGEDIIADTVVLALGNLPGRRPNWLHKLPLEDRHYIHDPWSRERWSQVQTAGADILIVGTGLTAVDKVLELTKDTRIGPQRIVAVSRHGLLPRAHLALPELNVPPLTLPENTALAALQYLKRQAGQKADWRLAVDGVRACTQEFWKHLPVMQKRSFLRHLQTYWDVHRHRMAPRIADYIKGLQGSGRLQVVAGRLEKMELSADGRRVDVVLAHRGGANFENLSVDLVVNCCGPQSNPRSIDCPLLSRLYERGMVVANDTNSGIKVDGLEVLDGAGHSSRNLYALGPLLKGALLESVAVPEIRVQAQELARLICQRAGKN